MFLQVFSSQGFFNRGFFRILVNNLLIQIDLFVATKGYNSVTKTLEIEKYKSHTEDFTKIF